MKGGQHLHIHRQHKSSPDLPRSVLGVLGNGSRDGGSGHLELDMPDMHAFDDQPQPQQKPGPSWVKWAIRKERSDAAARQNETQRQFDYVASAPAHEQLLTSKRATLQAAMQEQVDIAWEQHAARHAASWRQHAASWDRHHCSKWRDMRIEYIDCLDWLQGVCKPTAHLLLA
ncbi:hypothetical protein QJQ45_012788 [Haematococcus lacustris]|nr:hypothetical protein QJQ45_012788 [Haematococcus lacustris]